MTFAVADYNANTASAGATTLAVTASGVTAAQFLVMMVQVFVESGSTHGSVTDDASDTWTFLAETSDHSFQYYLCNSPTAGNRTVTFHAASSMTYGGIAYVLLCTGGPAQLDADGSSKTGTGTAITTNSITPAGAGDLFLAMAEDDTGNYTLSSIQNSFTSLTAGAASNVFAYRVYTGTTALNTGWTLSHSDGWESSILALKSASSILGLSGVAGGSSGFSAVAGVLSFTTNSSLTGIVGATVGASAVVGSVTTSSHSALEFDALSTAAIGVTSPLGQYDLDYLEADCQIGFSAVYGALTVASADLDLTEGAGVYGACAVSGTLTTSETGNTHYLAAPASLGAAVAMGALTIEWPAQKYAALGASAVVGTLTTKPSINTLITFGLTDRDDWTFGPADV